MPLADLPSRPVLVTGAAGFVGSHVIDAILASTDHSILAVDDMRGADGSNLAHLSDDPRVAFLQRDFADPEILAAVRAGEFAGIFHLASLRILDCITDPREAIAVMVTSVYELVDAWSGLADTPLVFSSTASVYGQADELPITEKTPPWPNTTLYGWNKAWAEGLIQSVVANGATSPYAFLRYFNIYGPRMDTKGAYTSVFVKWLAAVTDGEPIIVHGDGGASMDLVFVTDVARANVEAFTSGAVGAYNVASGTETTLAQLADLVIDLVPGTDSFVERVAPRESAFVARRRASVDKAAEQFGWRAVVPVEEGLAEMYQWWLATHAGRPTA